MGNNILKISKQDTIHCKEMQFYMKNFFGKYERIGSKACIWWYLLKHFLMANLIFLCGNNNIQGYF